MRASHQNEPASSHVAEEGKEDEEGDIGGLSSVERYDPALVAWEAVAPMGTARMAMPLPCWVSIDRTCSTHAGGKRA